MYIDTVSGHFPAAIINCMCVFVSTAGTADGYGSLCIPTAKGHSFIFPW